MDKQIELLAPCGSMEALKSAIKYGCNAVYLGGKQFGARAYANNFTNEEIIEAIKLAHLYNVKVYVTVNTLIYDFEFTNVMKYIEFLYNNDVDAVILQDIGLVSIVRKLYPDLDIHASTQMTIHNKLGAKFLKKEGVKRVVLARENTLEEIKQINQQIDIETEVFIHGALCVCYSGQCLMSSMIGGRSGNRGRCAQPCRKLYDLMIDNDIVIKNKYLLSPRDLKTLEHIPEIIESGVTSLKIEGRMKSPEYVAIVVSLYRKAIDMYYQHKRIMFTKNELNDLKQIFNRGFTTGFIFGTNGKKFINHEQNNNEGVYSGIVTEVSNSHVKIKCKNSFNLQDGVYFKKSNEGLIITKMFVNGKERSSANIGDYIILYCKNNICLGDKVYKTKDYRLEQRYSHNELYKIGINAEIYLIKNKKIRLIIDDGKNNVNIESDYIVQESMNYSIDYQMIKRQLAKLGNTPFELKNIKIIKDDDIFVTIGALNDIRRQAIKRLIEIRSNYYKRIKKSAYRYEKVKSIFNKKVDLTVYCQTLEQVKIALEESVDRIYVYEDIYEKLDNVDNEKVYLAKNRINHYLDNKNSKKMLISDVGSLSYINDDVEIVLNYPLNITNSESIKFYNNINNIKYITLSPEINEKLYNNLFFENKSILEIIIYGNQELMETKYCFFNDNCIRQCQNDIYLIDKKREKFLVRMDNNCHMHIYNSKKMILCNEVIKLINYGYRNFRLQLSNENRQDTKNIIKAYQELIFHNNSQLLTSIITNLKKKNLFTRGYYYRNIL